MTCIIYDSYTQSFKPLRLLDLSCIACSILAASTPVVAPPGCYCTPTSLDVVSTGVQ